MRGVTAAAARVAKQSHHHASVDTLPSDGVNVPSGIATDHDVVAVRGLEPLAAKAQRGGAHAPNLPRTEAAPGMSWTHSTQPRTNRLPPRHNPQHLQLRACACRAPAHLGIGPKSL